MTMLKLGTQTGSLVNHLYSRSVNGQPVPTIGMGATILNWTDRKAGTIIEVNKTIIRVQEDNATRIDNNGMSECQEYEYTANPDGYVHTFRQDKNGMWSAVYFNEKTKRYNKSGGSGVLIGRREQYHDYSF